MLILPESPAPSDARTQSRHSRPMRRHRLLARATALYTEGKFAGGPRDGGRSVGVAATTARKRTGTLCVPALTTNINGAAEGSTAAAADPPGQ